MEDENEKSLIRFPLRRMNELERRSRSKQHRYRRKNWIERTIVRLLSIRMCARVCMRNCASRARKKGKKRIEREEKKSRTAFSRKPSGRGKKFVTAKRNGGLWKNSERKARRRSNRFPFSIKNSMNRHASVYRFLGSRIVSAGDGKTDERANVENLFCPGRCANIRL